MTVASGTSGISGLNRPARGTPCRPAYMAAMTREEFEATYTLRFEHEVEFGEIDMMRHVNNVCYGVWAERVRTVYFGDVLGRESSAARASSWPSTT